jgi:hypothetical protein
MKMGSEAVTVAKYDDFLLASMAKQSLDDAGIPAVVVGEMSAALYPGTSFGVIEVQVPAERFDEAVATIEEFEGSLEQNYPELEDDPEEPIDE